MEGPLPAQICIKGHLINEDSDWDPSSNRNFCPKCGSATVLSCSGCKAKIISADSNPYRQFAIPSFCYNCGAPFEWTKSAIQAANQFADELGELSLEERDNLKATVSDLIVDSARTPLAASRAQKILAKIGGPAAQAFTQILISVLTGEAKKQFGLL